MAKFVLAYRGGSGMGESQAEQAKEMEQWMAWFGSLGDAVIDGGNPFGQSTTVGGSKNASPLGGYSIISANDLNDAAAKAKGCPVLSSGGSVDIYETIDV